MEEAGYAKAKDLLVYEGSARDGYLIPDRFLRFAERPPAIARKGRVW